jgi:hypothetical protein
MIPFTVEGFELCLGISHALHDYWEWFHTQENVVRGRLDGPSFGNPATNCGHASLVQEIVVQGIG